MDQIIKRKKLESSIKLEETFVISPKNEVKEEEVDEQKADKKSRLFKKHKKTISIEKVKRNIDVNMYINRFIV
ncbi:MAG: hypothetical protein ACXAEX_16545 [Promethearchaeota archaeon]